MPVAASTFDTSTGGTEWGALAAFGISAMVPGIHLCALCTAEPGAAV
jgi:hypothetical protein